MKSALCRGVLSMFAIGCLAVAAQGERKAGEPFDIEPTPIAQDKEVVYDYPIVYVRSPRFVERGGKERPAGWAEFAHIFNVNPGTDLMLLKPDGSEEVLVEGGEGAVQDPYVSFDGESVYYTHLHEATGGPNKAGADIYKIHVPSRKIVRLTEQKFTPAEPDAQQPYGVYNMHPCPLPGDRVAYVSNRNGYLPPPKSYPQVALQLHTMDDDGKNIETIGHLNLAGALHPVILKDGRIIFSSLENMGLRNYILWGIWSIHPDGTNWNPLVSALHGYSSPSSWHFQTQLSDENIVVELYYNQNQKGFGPLFKLPPKTPPGKTAFGPADTNDPRNTGFNFMGSDKTYFRFPFTPYGMELLTPWIGTGDRPSEASVPGDEKSPRIGKVTHPCGAPDNHLLVAWTLGPIGGSSGSVRDYMVPKHIDSGIYLAKHGQPTDQPGDMLLIKNDPKYNEQWPRPLVSYKRIYGVDQPRRLAHANDGKKSKLLPEGTPFGLVGTSSFYKRESITMGGTKQSSVTADYPENYKDAYSGSAWNWRGQGADAGRYENSDIHAVRILAMVPNTHTSADGNRRGYPAFHNHAMERLRIFGEVPLRKFVDGKQPADPDNNPDTSFLAKIPTDVAFTFQTIDKQGMVLNMAQTWHQLRPGEVRHDCGGCHAHSQQPTLFESTYAAREDYQVFDLTETTPLITSKREDQSKQQWDAESETGVRYEDGPHDVEYFRDIKPILARSCVACHTKDADSPAGNLVLDDDEQIIEGLPGSYFRLAADDRAKFSPRKVEEKNDGRLVARGLPHQHSASHYVWMFQSRRSSLIWKLYGRRLDGWTNETVPTEVLAMDDPRRKDMQYATDEEKQDKHFYFGDVDYAGSQMPPPKAVKEGKVQPLSEEDRRMFVRWVDLGCPVDLDPDYDPSAPQASDGYLADDQRPTLTLTYPVAGENKPLTRLLIGMYDHESGLDKGSFTVTADFAIDGVPAGDSLANRFNALPDNRWELKLDSPIDRLASGTLTVSINDQGGNTTAIERKFSVSRE